jgi:ABC-type enterobactin transport system permease subunit
LESIITQPAQPFSEGIALGGGTVGAGAAGILGDDPVLALSDPELAKKKRRQNLMYGGLLGAGTGAMLMSGADVADQLIASTGVLGEGANISE